MKHFFFLGKKEKGFTDIGWSKVQVLAGAKPFSFLGRKRNVYERERNDLILMRSVGLSNSEIPQKPVYSVHRYARQTPVCLRAENQRSDFLALRCVLAGAKLPLSVCTREQHVAEIFISDTHPT